MTPETIAGLRLRLERGDPLCLNEHTIHRDLAKTYGRRRRAALAIGAERWWITCGPDVIGETRFTLRDLGNGDQSLWAESVFDRHCRAVAERIVAELLDLVAP